ncbi:MAG: M12 family metallo-peptidase [Candidatus Binatia bacterium]
MTDDRREAPRRQPNSLKSTFVLALLGLGALGLAASAREALAGPTDAAASASNVVAAGAADLADRLRSIPRGGAVRIDGASLDGFAGTAGLELRRFDVATGEARFVVQAASGPREVKPDLPVYLRGSVDGLRGSVAVLSVRASGEVRGVVSGGDRTWLLAAPSRAASRRAGAPGLRAQRVENLTPTAGRDFSCETVDNPGVPRRAAATSPSASLSAGTPRLPITHTAQIAVELDLDFYQSFAPDSDSAILYALDLLAFTGTLGEAELGMNVQVPFLQLWTSSPDPFSGGASSRLGQLRSRWNQVGSTNCGGSDCTGLDRSTVILLSAASMGGVAYVPGLCDSWHSPTAGYSYAMAGGLEGDFDIDNPSSVWDIVVTTHELGHNFGSHHTHCYSPPVDNCYAGDDGCYGGATSLPAGCPGSGQACGTIMGYCHLLNGGIDNVALTFGAGHPYGVDPDRVPAVMMNRIAVEAAAAPACLAATGGMAELAVEKAGTGSGTVTTAPAALDCGDTCRTWFDADTVVTLTATPGPFSVFQGWSGDADCNDGQVTMSAARACTATFDGNCGAGNDDCDDGNPCTIDSCPGDDHCENAGTPRDTAQCLEAGKAILKISDAADPAADKLLWQWKAGDAFDQVDLGNPATSTDYTLCVYDATAGVTSLVTSLNLGAGGSGWKNRAPRGWSFSDRNGTSDGIKKVLLKPGLAGKTKVKVAAAGVGLPLPTPFSMAEYFDQDPSVVLQLLTEDDVCWTSSFSPGSTPANTPTSFKATGN